jgi:hypothetical protein
MRGELYFPFTILAFIALVPLSLPTARQRGGRYVVACAMIVNILALIPIAIMSYVFSAGGHPTAQGNVGSETAMNAWSTWVHIWPTLLFEQMGCVAISFVWVIGYAVWNFRSSPFKADSLPFWYILLTFVHCLLALLCVAGNFPSA